MPESVVMLLVLVVVVIVALIVFFSFFPLGLWISAAASGVHISIFSLVGMRFRRINPNRIVVAINK